MSQAHHHLDEALAGAPSPEAVAWIASGLSRWLRPDNTLDLARCLGLQTACKSRQALRDELLRQAAKHMAGGPTARAEQLSGIARDFEARIWPLWRDLPEPPARAGAVLTLLWRAKRYGASLDLGPRAMFNILA